jgi:hypothetical protein
MPNTITYKQILTYFSSIAYHHEQIKSFGFGDIEQCTNDIITKQEPKYTRMYIVPDGVEFNQNHIHYNFSVIIMDKVEDDLSNLEDVMSDTLEIVMDVWTIFYQSYTAEQGDFSKIIVGDWDPDTHPFVERFETILGGWTLHIKMSAPFDYNRCDLPIVDNYGFPQDESYSSYKQILVDWQRFAQAHEQVRSYGFGPMEQLTVDRITKVEPKYPRLYFVPNTTRLNTSHMHVTWNVIICDKINNDLTNLQDVLSDTLEIAKDFFSKAYLSDYDAEFDATLEPWLERTETILGGWTLPLSIQQKFDYNRCVLPVTSFVSGLTWEEVQNLWITEAQKWKNV